jgi:GNAT superfamily N-acetyltransferase
MRGSPLAHRQAHAERLLNAPVPFCACELRVHGEPVACGQFAIEGRLAGLYDVFTTQAARGRGLAGVLCRHLLEQARTRGATHAYLQVEADNHAALAVYRRLGFVDGYGYHYRTRDPASA